MVTRLSISLLDDTLTQSETDLGNTLVLDNTTGEVAFYNWKTTANLYEIFKLPSSYGFMKIFHWNENGLTLFMELDLDHTRFSIFARCNLWGQKMSELRFVICPTIFFVTNIKFFNPKKARESIWLPPPRPHPPHFWFFLKCTYCTKVV